MGQPYGDILSCEHCGGVGGCFELDCSCPCHDVTSEPRVMLGRIASRLEDAVRIITLADALADSVRAALGHPSLDGDDERSVRCRLFAYLDAREARGASPEPAPIQRFVPAMEGDKFLPLRFHPRSIGGAIAAMQPYEVGNVWRERDGLSSLIPARRHPDGSVEVIEIESPP